MASADRSRGRASGAATRQKILDAALRLFAEHGYSGTSVRMVARELGLTDPAIHYHFPSKQSLYHALLKQPAYGPLPLESSPPTRETLLEHLVLLFSWWAENPSFGRMLLREQLSGEPLSVSYMPASLGAWSEAVDRPLGILFGVSAPATSTLLFELMCGIYWDAILSYGDGARDVIAQPYFQQRLREMIDLALPPEEGVGA